MKILYLSGSVFPSEISHTLSKIRVCKAFSESGHTVLLSGVGDASSVEVKEFYGVDSSFDVKLVSVPKHVPKKGIFSVIRKIIVAIKALETINSFSPDILYSRLTLIELLFVRRDLPIIYEMHSLGFLGKGWFSRLMFFQIIRRKNIRKIVVSSKVLAMMIEKEIDFIDIEVAPLSAELPVKLDVKTIEVFRRDRTFGASNFNIGYTGYLDTEGIRGTEIICYLSKELPAINFHIVGGDPRAVLHWKNYANKIGRGDNLFFYGHQRASDIPYYLSIFDVVLAPLQIKTFKRAPLGANMSPLKLAQYMAYGKAIIASNIANHKEILEHNRNALLVEADNISAWRSAVQLLIENKDLRSSLEERAYSDFNARYTPQARVTKILSGVRSFATDE
jgi:glycosyltransferase involved in cell wall biosynthesis